MKREVFPYAAWGLVFIILAGVIKTVNEMTVLVSIAMLPLVAMLIRTAVRVQVVRKDPYISLLKKRSVMSLVSEGLAIILLTVVWAILSPNLVLTPILLAEVGLAVWLFARTELVLLDAVILKVAQGKKTNDLHVIRDRLGHVLFIWATLVFLAILLLSVTDLNTLYFVTLGAMLAMYILLYALNAFGDEMRRASVLRHRVTMYVAAFLAVDTMVSLYQPAVPALFVQVYIFAQIAAFSILSARIVWGRFHPRQVVIVHLVRVQDVPEETGTTDEPK